MYINDLMLNMVVNPADLRITPIHNPNVIKNYKYEEIVKHDDHGNPSKYMRTTMVFDDGRVTTAEAPTEIANQYVGFVICAAKHAYGNDNTISDLADYWIINKPKIDARKRAAEEKIEQQRAEAERIRAKKIEKKRIYRAAKARKEAYEAAQFAQRKYGVPCDWEK